MDDWHTVQQTQIRAIAEQVKEAVAAGDGVALANLAAPVEGVTKLEGALREMAEDAIVGAKAEAAAQGVAMGTVDLDDSVARLLSQRAEATATVLARSLSDSASRKALGLGTESLSPDEVAAAVQGHLEGLSDSFLNDMLGGALTQAQNTGRRAVMNEKDSRVYASELLDGDTCTNCAAVDEREYDSLEDAESDYPTGGFKDCLGGPRCRGTLVAVYTEGDDVPPPPPPPKPKPAPRPPPEPLDDGDLKARLAPWAKGLSADQKNKIESYSRLSYKETNMYLRGQLPDLPDKKKALYQKRVDAINSAMGDAPDLPSGAVYRGVGPHIGLAPGKAFVEPGFTSTSVSQDFAGEWVGRSRNPGSLLTIRLKEEGQKGAYVPSAIGFEDEKELILPSATKYRVVRQLEDYKYTKTSVNGLTGETTVTEVVVPHWELEVLD